MPRTLPWKQTASTTLVRAKKSTKPSVVNMKRKRVEKSALGNDSEEDDLASKGRGNFRGIFISGLCFA